MITLQQVGGVRRICQNYVAQWDASTQVLTIWPYGLSPVTVPCATHMEALAVLDWLNEAQ